jgi:hypothetical protein
LGEKKEFDRSGYEPDLFGGETKAVTHPTFKQRAGYRKATAHELARGRVCKNCEFLQIVGGGSRNYFKCENVGISSSAATDLRLGGTCPRFKEI